MKSLVLIVVALSAIFQFIAAFMAIRLIRVSGRLVAWVFLAVGFLVMGMRRAVTITHIGEGLSRGDMPAEILALLISLLLLCGISMIGPLFSRINHEQNELAKIHQELVENEIRYRTVADFTSDWEFWLAPDHTFKYISPSCEELSGYTPEDFYRSPQLMSEIIHPEDLPRYRSHTHNIRENGLPEPIDFRIITRDGQERWIAHVCRPVVGTDGVPLGQRASNRDITERKRVEAELRKSEQRFRELNEALEQRIAEREQAERELREQEGRLRMVLETLPVGVWIVDAEGVIVFGNQAGQRIWSGAQYVGVEQYDKYKGWWSNTGVRIEPEKWGAARAVTRGDTSLNEEIDIECFDGARKTILHSAVPLRDAGQRITGAVIINQDISYRKQAEQALMRREADLRRAQEIAKIGSWTYAMADEIWWSDELYRIYGVSPETFIPTIGSFLNLIHPDDRAAMETWMQACSADENPGELVFRIIWPDGTIRFISGRGELVHDLQTGLHMAGTGQDITERKQAEKALAESESAFRATFEQAAVGMARMAPDGRWLLVNQRLCDVVGYSRDELLGLRLQDITYPDELDSVLGNMREMLAGNLDTFSMEKRYIRKDDSVVWINLTVGLVRDCAGAPDYFTCVVEDISMRKRAEEALTEKQRLLEELNLNLERRIADAVSDLREKDRILMLQGRQAAMGEMIGNIAHQWRQPLNTLGLIVQELLITYGREEFSKEILKANVEKAMGLISHMSKTIEDFRNYFKPDKEKILFNVNQAVAKTLSLVEPSLKRLEITMDVIEKADAEISGYANEYSQVLLNILLNCRDAFEVGPRDRARVIAITIFTDHGRSVVTIADNAGGIPDNIIHKIFDPYFTTKDPDKGTGIGLYMAKTIIEKNMGGRLTVRNTGDGAEFRIEV
ncbi:PAS domain-containing sensor histidine kinase [Geomesophilobacter sediminis]|uniref:histidine kinase n=1 Tax=Geomesophilobacter sediminis TaxID=2798584 RepID=A0A8J7LZ18_9BACT|nr:PAS domain-containing sensor histidine kinase [Geomesophilobacter sediminis]MBJ6725761.1 PAS domain S-box protein [Geomesophilobacter sediminis]